VNPRQGARVPTSDHPGATAAGAQQCSAQASKETDMRTVDIRNETSTQSSETPTWSQLKLERRSPTYWRVTFEHPPINTITATTITELAELVDLIEHDRELNVVVFDSANPDFFLAHYDTENDPGRTAALPAGPTGMHPWLDLTARLSRSPMVSIAVIRGRARGAGSEFVLACDLRFASRENTLLGQFEVGVGFIPGGGPMARLSRLAGRGRALEVLLVADDLDGPRAELYGYVNRAIADVALDDEVEAMALRISGFDHEAIARTKAHVDQATLPPDSELAAALPDFFGAFGQPGPQARQAKLVELGLNTDGDLERNLGRRVAEAMPDITT
jgi:enoyl-CoA hydratase/carnithine racemase